ncbi:MAG: hypothetical protein U9R40_02415 [Synergistota bacterium]|nr:hypothetical protein [Synergistota bacterium]
MPKRNGFLVLLLGVCLFAAYLPCAASAFEQSELARIAREAPAEGTMENAGGLVLLREISYRLLSNGATERTTTWVIREERGLPPRWRNWAIPVPEGGSCEVLESALYDPSSAQLRYPLLPGEKETGTGGLVEVRLPNDMEGNIAVLSYRQVFPGEMNLDDAVFMGLDIPMWEQRVKVVVPARVGLVWRGRGVPDPEVVRGAAMDWYTWTLLNTPAESEHSVLAEGRPVLIFSLRKGLRYALSEAESLADGLDMSPPPEVQAILDDANGSRAGERLLAYMSDPAKHLGGTPWYLVRSAENIPADGPWTLWESAFLMKSWIERAGWKAGLRWLPVLTPDDDAPATVKLWRSPALELEPPGGSSFFYLPGQQTPAGVTAAHLLGRTLFSAGGENVSRIRVPSGSAGDHRLSIDWDLELTPEGEASGDVTLTVRGGWTGILSDGDVPDDEDALAILRRFAWPNTPDALDGVPVVEKVGTGYRVVLALNTQLGIPGGRGLLGRVPAVIMPWQLELASGGFGNGLLFPFVLEQSFLLRLPDGLVLMDLPPVRSGGSGKIKIEESMRYRKKKQIITGEHKLVVADDSLDESQRQALVNAVRQGIEWSRLTLPLSTVE